MNQSYRGSYGQRSASANTSTAPRETKKHSLLTEDNYVEMAEAAIDTLIKNNLDRRGNPKIVSTSKIRNLLAMTADIYNEVSNHLDEKLSQEQRGRIAYLNVRFIYDSGRDKDVKALVDEADILAHIRDIKDSRRQFILFSRYMEALVAFRKYKVDRDE